jgi:type I restriction enzyme S subunit
VKEGWRVARLGDVCCFEKEQDVHTGLPYVGLEDIESGTGRFLGATNPVSVKSATFRFSPEHVLYGRLRPYLNKVLLPDFEGHCSTEIFPIRVGREVLREYLFYWLSMDATVKSINSTSTGARMPRANMGAVLEFEIPIPTLSEQRRIVAILDEAFEGIATVRANAEKNLGNAREVFESHLQAVFTERGDGWVEKPLEAIGKTQTGSTPKTTDQSNYGNFISFVKPGDFNTDGSLDYDKDGLSESGAKGARKVPAGSVLMVCIGATIGKCGYCDQDVTTNQQVNALTPNDGSSNRFLYYQMLTDSFQRKVIHGSGQATLPIINKSKWSALSLWLPPTLAEQEKIAAKFDALVEETHRLARLYEKKLAELDALKKSLLHQAFSGAL